MSIKLMRFVDYWIGIPLCFLFSVSNSISKVIRSNKKPEKVAPQKILFIKLSEIGAIILAYPLLKRAKQVYPLAEIFFLTFEKNRSVFEVLGKIVTPGNILTLREDSIWQFALGFFRVVRKIRKERIDIVFDLELFSRFTAVVTFLSNAHKKIGFYHYTFEGLYRGNLFTHNIQYNPLVHISKSYLSLWQVVKKEKKVTPELEERIEEGEIILPKFISAIQTRRRIGDNLKRFGVGKENRLFLINPGEGTLPLREWPLENFIALSKMLLEDTKNYIIIVGTESSSKRGELLWETVDSKRCINSIGQTTLVELLELFSISDALIANDCGLAHLASLTSIKKFIIFGPESPQVFGPLDENNWMINSNLPCSPCLSALNHRNSACRDNKCLKIIRPVEVYELIRKSL